MTRGFVIVGSIGHQHTLVVNDFDADVSLRLNETNNFSKSYDIISLNSYFMKIWRVETDNREVEGSGTLSTP